MTDTDGPVENPPLYGTFRSWGRIGGAARYFTADNAWQDAIERETFAEADAGLIYKILDLLCLGNSNNKLRQKLVASKRLGDN
ncbi:hypothetical protein F4809DRAFT_660981 [Biscogniauxia mediterranea]|nr:hypothetical protein F4809DRAFT_660981 [Biscogniauxia mediterranea]